ncbi:hypothetical protein HYFRA_00005773 [Hymenoscyphus fraxineus]|uniref:Hpc2-related domain-containing protein n=1 Tax=Hymenoscyphus fraxineus TaxID=746836 RepID=A0A9N9PIA0_9HELO|nr:hypothetical protein HYFRA_00005773 [Hymenoscyphus fraxineus]
MSTDAPQVEAGVGQARRASVSSASGLSSPPHSSPEPNTLAASMNNRNSLNNVAVAALTSNANPPEHHDPNVRTLLPPSASASVEPPVKVRKKPGRKPKSFYLSQEAGNGNPENSASNTDAPKAKRTRKPRDPNAPKIERKKKRTSHPAGTIELQVGAARAPGEPVGSFFMHPGAAAAGEVNPSENGRRDPIPNPTASFFNNADPPQTHHHSPPQPPAHPQQVRTSGQNYDPIRSNYDPVRETVVSHNPFSNPQGQGAQGSPHLPQSMNRASASPSISSLVDPPNQALTSPSIATQSFFNQQQAQARLYQNDGASSHPPSPTVVRLAPSVPAEAPPPKQPAMSSRKSDGPSLSKKASLGQGSTATSSAGASPKPPKVKDSSKEIFPAPPPLPGSGLMGMGSGGEDGTEFRAPTVVLHIPMNGETNKIINFTRLAEELYGWDALHPRLAAQRDRLARVAAAGAALERNGSGKDSGDDMSLDSEGEGSNVEMGGMSDGRTGTDGGAKKIPRKRRMKEDQYDKDDGFVDDSELLWEEHAAAAQDGFFVYSGPLNQDSEKTNENLRADGQPKRGRGRGSRGGRGGTARGGAATAAAAVGGVAINERTGRPISGPGSRGGSTTRKPRITKADRARMEQEKIDREKMGTLASMPAGYGNGMVTLASNANMGNTPMVFNQ